MPLRTNEQDGGRLLVVHLSGTLVKADYQPFMHEFEKLVRRNKKIRVLFNMHNFDGWDAGAAWEDIKFDFHHFCDIDRIAMVGDKKWEHGLATFFKPFTKATIRYFDQEKGADAREWLENPKLDLRQTL